jgi:ATP-dependent Zn protease
MKLVALMCVEEYVEDARKLLKEQNVPAFSEVGMQGYKMSEPDESDNWFASKHILDNSHMFFSMVDDKKQMNL